MSIIQIVATAIAILLGLALFAYVDREHPEELDDTEADKTRRYLAEHSDREDE